MTPETQNTDVAAPRQADFQELLRAKLRQAVRLTMMSVLQEEVEAVTGARPYQRTSARRDHRNGEYERGLVTSLGAVRLMVPRPRQGFETEVCERYQGRQAELDVAIGEMFVKGGKHRRRRGDCGKVDRGQAQPDDGVAGAPDAGG